MDKILGSCSQCGGDVTVPESYMSVVPPVPTCKSCGATVKRPVIETENPVTVDSRKFLTEYPH